MNAEQDVDVAADEQQAQDQDSSMLDGVTSHTPWWIVSIVLHGLVVTLAGLVSMTMTLPENEPVVTVIDITPPVVVVRHAPTPIPSTTDDDLRKSFDNKKWNNGEVAEHFIPPDIMAKESDRDETANKRESHGGVRGEPDALIIYSPKGELGTAGGGGENSSAISEMSIGVGTSGWTGTGGGKYGVDGSGIGPGSGPGFATRGKPGDGGKEFRFKRRGITRGTENAVTKALQWLAYHQEPDGHWDAKKFGGLKVDTAVTSMALLAFLGAGHTEKVGNHKDNVKRAVAWLKSKQATNGLIFDTTDEGGHRGIGYPMAMATMALAEAAGMANVPETKAAAQKAINYCTEIHQQGEGSDKLGWRYAAKSEGDISVTGWFVMALKSAKMAGLKVDPLAFDGAIAFIDKCEVKGAAGDSYGSASKYSYKPGSDTNHRRSAIGNLARQFLGWDKAGLQSSVELFVKDGGVPNFGANGESIDLYYWYYGTLCVFQQGGDLWKKWNAAMIPTLCDNQCKKGDDEGSWNPLGAFSSEWGRVGQTALAALCLEVYYRY
jgi:hypothetical protein